MSDIKTLYRFLRERNIIKKINPLYEDTPIIPKEESAPEELVDENPAQTDEVKNHNRQEYLNWKLGLTQDDLLAFNTIFNEQ